MSSRYVDPGSGKTLPQIMTTTTRQSLAFTLIELLASIAVVAILSALCMAGLSKARIKAYEVQDVNSLRQLGISIHLMMNDLAEVKPNDFFDPADKLWAYTSDSANESASAWDDRVAKAASVRKLMSSAYWRKLNAASLSANEPYPRSYSVNAAQSLFPSPPPDSGQPDWERLSVPTFKIASKTRLILLFMTYAPNTPGIAYSGAANPIYSGVNKTGYSAQMGRTPLLFVDGHAVVADLAHEYNDSTYWGE